MISADNAIQDYLRLLERASVRSPAIASTATPASPDHLFQRRRDLVDVGPVLQHRQTSQQQVRPHLPVVGRARR